MYGQRTGIKNLSKRVTTLTDNTRGFIVLDGKPYIVAKILDSDCYEFGTRFVSLNLIELEETHEPELH